MCGLLADYRGENDDDGNDGLTGGEGDAAAQLE